MGKTYKVIEIIDEYSILINYGRSDGASNDDSVRIIAKGPEVIDPDTNMLLGTFDAVKADLLIDTAYDKFSVCKSIKVKVTNALISPLSQFQSTSKVAEPLTVDRAAMSRKAHPKDTVIRVGDLVEIL